jgi:hypothetical protein
LRKSRIIRAGILELAEELLQECRYPLRSAWIYRGPASLAQKAIAIRARDGEDKRTMA